MSTLKQNITAKRIALLASKGEKIFHINDLANLWSITNRNTLRITLKRYIKNSLLHRIYKGFYSLVPLDNLDPLLIGTKALHIFCYVSTETILYRAGYISQKPRYYTFISPKSLIIKIRKYHFKSRQLNEKYLYNSEGVTIQNGIQIASTERSIADMLYFNPKYHFDKKINWQNIKKIQQKIGYPLTFDRYDDTAKT